EVLDASDVGCAGLLREGVNPRLDGRAEVGGAEGRGRGEQDHVHSGVEDLLVGVEASEEAAFQPIGKFALGNGVLANHLQFLLRFRDIEVAHGVELHVVVRGERVQHGASAPTSGADDADLQLFVVRGAQGDGGKSDSGRGGGGGSRRLDEVTAAGV